MLVDSRKMVSLEEDLGRAVLETHDFSDDSLIINKDDKTYLFEVSNPSKKGFEVSISVKKNGDYKHLTSMPIMYKSRGPQGFMPEFESNISGFEKLNLANLAMTYALSMLRKNNYESFGLLLESDFENSNDKGKERLLLFDTIEKLNAMNWKENSQGQMLTKYL